MIIDGKAQALEKENKLRQKLKTLKTPPRLAVVLVGEDPASKLFASLKVKKARELGIVAELRADLNTDADGIIVQLPDGEKLVDNIPPEKDVDGLTGHSKYLSAAARGILAILAPFDTKGKTFVLVGQGRLVGKPLASYLEKNEVKVIRCDEFTPDLKSETLQGDILVVATGKEKLVTTDMVKPGAIVIDCGALKPEVDFDKVKDKALAITPVPGGLGPLTVICLLENLVELAEVKEMS